MFKRKTGLLFMSALLALGLVACGGGGTEEPAAEPAAESDAELTTVQEGKLTVGMEAAYAPFNWTQTDDSNGAIPLEEGSGYANGYDVQIAKQIADELGLELTISKIEWDGLPPAVNSGRVDAIIAGMSPTAERRQQIDFSEPYYKSQLVMVVREDGDYADATSLEDFEGAMVTAQMNTFHYTVIDQIPGVNQLEAMQDFGSMRTALQSGAIDAYVSEKPEGLSASAALPGFKMIEFDEGQGFTFEPDDVNIAAGFKKGNTALLEAFNKALANISDEDRNALMEEVIAFQPAATE